MPSGERPLYADPANPVELRFKIDAYTPDTMPLPRLLSYLRPLATILGEPDHVHLMEIHEGTTTAVLAVERHAYPQVSRHVRNLQEGLGSPSAKKAQQQIEGLASDDDARPCLLLDELGEMLVDFSEISQNGHVEYGPFSEPGVLDGVPIVVGGKNDPVPVHIETPHEVYVCKASRALAKRIGEHLFTDPIRVWGVGQWLRDHDGQWNMLGFLIEGFEILRTESLSEVTDRLRGIEADWKSLDDPLGDLANLRSADD